MVSLDAGRVHRFSELQSDARVIAECLHKASIPAGGVVVSLSGNGPGFVALFLGCLERRLVFVPLNGDVTEAEVQRVATEYRASAVVVPESQALAETGVRLDLPGGLALGRIIPEQEPLDLGDAILLKLTSGSTDRPRAVVVSEGNLVSDGRHVIEAMGIRTDDVNWGALPLAHSYALGNLVLPLLLQGTQLAFRDRFLPATFLEDVARSGATVFPGVPWMFEHLSRAPSPDRLPLCLRLLLTAGAQIEPATVARFHARFGLKVHSFYGSSETGGITYDDSDGLRLPLDVGRPLPGTEVTLVPSDRGDTDEGTGRIHVCGEAVARGYVEGMSSGVSGFCDGGFLTGDLGRFHADGRLFLSGRVSSFVNVAGRKVDPREIERAIEAHPSVAGAKVLGIPCETRGEKLVACVVPKLPGLDEIQMRAHCAARLSPFKIPREFVFVDAFPVDSRGKTERRALVELVSRVARSRGEW